MWRSGICVEHAVATYHNQSDISQWHLIEQHLNDVVWLKPSSHRSSIPVLSYSWLSFPSLSSLSSIIILIITTIIIQGGRGQPHVNVWLYGRIIHNFIPCPVGAHYPNDDDDKNWWWPSWMKIIILPMMPTPEIVMIIHYSVDDDEKKWWCS